MRVGSDLNTSSRASCGHTGGVGALKQVGPESPLAAVNGVMTEYRCFLFGPDDRPFGGDRNYVAAETFDAPSDAEARTTAHEICRRRDHKHGFEVWQSDALVHRHHPMMSEPDKPKKRSRRKRELATGETDDD